MPVTVVPVRLGPRSYDVVVGRDALARLAPLALRLGRHRTVVVASRRVLELHGGAIRAATAALSPAAVVPVPDGERFKTPGTLGRVHDALLDARVGRDGLVLAVGGGVVTDLAGFAAATWMRGVDWMAVPTTLLAMVDAALGGKVGVNHPRAKNLIGAFHQPRLVVADTAFLDTLPGRERRSGAFEMLKSGLVGDRALVEAVRAAPPGLSGWPAGEVEQAVAAACRVKAAVVSRDERESGLRRVLNLGHTLGHALEAVTSFRRFTHGEAVGWGLLGAAWLARRRGLLGAGAFATAVEAVERVGPRPPLGDLDPDAVVAALGRDKKAKAGRVPFVLPVALGRVRVVEDVGEAEVRATLDALAARERGAPKDPLA